MKTRAATAILLFFLALSYPTRGAAQNGKQQRIAELAYNAEMAHEGECADALAFFGGFTTGGGVLSG